MKSEDIKDLCNALCTVIFFLIVFIFGVIWLNRGYKIEDVEQRIMFEIDKDREQYQKDKEENTSAIINLVMTGLAKNEVMPSCLKGRK